MSGTGALGDYLARELKARAGIKRVRADTFGYLQRSFPGIASSVDRNEAYGAGFVAVNATVRLGYKSWTVGIQRKKGRKYDVEYVQMPITNAAKFTKSVPKAFIAKNGHDVTPAFIEYAKPIVGDLPHCEVI